MLLAFPKIAGSFWRVPIIRVMAFGVYIGVLTTIWRSTGLQIVVGLVRSSGSLFEVLVVSAFLRGFRFHALFGCNSGGSSRN